MTHRLFNETKQSFRVALPLMAAQLMQSASGFMGTLFAARLGKQALAASALVGFVWLTLVVVFFGILNAISVLMAQNFGAGRPDDAGKVGIHGIYWALILSFPVMFLLWFVPIVLYWTGQPTSVILFGTHYIHALILSVLPLSLLIAMEQILIGMSQTRVVFWINVVQIPCEIVANYAFVFGKFGLPAFGIAGLGYGFASVFVIAAIFIALYLTKSKLGQTCPIWQRFGEYNKVFTREIFRIGWPIGVMFGVEVSAFMVVGFLMSVFGVDTLAAHQIGMQYLGLTMALIFGLATATGVRAGNAVGREDREGIILAHRASVIIGVICMGLVGLIYLFIPHWLVALDMGPHYVSGGSIEKQATLFLAVIAIFQMFDACRWAAIGALRGIKDTRFSLALSFFTFWLGVLPIGALFAFTLHWAGFGMWVGITAGIAIGAALFTWRFYYLIKKVDLLALVLI